MKRSASLKYQFIYTANTVVYVRNAMALEEIGADMGSGARMVRLSQVRLAYFLTVYESSCIS